jgi:3-oxoacyl-[acyl-carrier protein] reductase
VDLGLENKVAWVNGGSSGLGRATATALAREGATVAVSSRGREGLEAAAAEIERSTGGRCIAVPLDVTDGDAIGSAATEIEQRLGPVDILVANAGGPPPGTFDELGEDALMEAFRLTTASAWRLTKAVLPGMRARRRGALLYITSSSTKEIIPNLLLSNMMRAAVVGMAKTISKQVAPDGVRVVCVAPGRIETPRIVQLDEAEAARSGRPVEEISVEGQARLPMGRYGRPQEFGEVTAFLASERASYVTGVSVVVDGGLLSGVLS